LDSKGSKTLDFQAYIIIPLANPVSILILPPFKLSAMNLTPKNLVSKSLLSYKRGGMLLLDLRPFKNITI
jgi:hypothetical protein